MRCYHVTFQDSHWAADWVLDFSYYVFFLFSANNMKFSCKFMCRVGLLRHYLKKKCGLLTMWMVNLLFWRDFMLLWTVIDVKNGKLYAFSEAR